MKFADGIKANTLRYGNSPGLSGWIQFNHTSLYKWKRKSRKFWEIWWKEGQERFKVGDLFQPIMSGLEDGGKRPWTEEYSQFLDTRNGPPLTASKKRGTAVLQPQGTKYCQQSEGAREQISLLQQEMQPCRCLHFSHTEDLYQTSELQNCQVINVCYVKPLNWW